MRACVVSLVAVAMIAAAAPARAQPGPPPPSMDKAYARRLAQEGLALMDSKDAEAALIKFDAALAIVKVPTVLVFSAECLVSLGRIAEAAERYEQAESTPVDEAAPAEFQTTQREAVAQAKKERAELLPRVPSLVITIEGARSDEVVVMLDGAVIPTPPSGARKLVDPGAHHVVGYRGPESSEIDVTLAEGQSAPILLHFKPAPITPIGATQAEPAPGSPPLRTLGFAGIVAGGALLATSAVLYGVALGKEHSLEQVCNPTCPTERRDDVSSYDTFKTTTFVTLIGGAALAGAGTVLVLTARAKKTSGVSLGVSLGGATVRAVF